MFGFVLQRLVQAVAVMFCTSLLVFIGVYAIGNPIDILISRDAAQEIRAQVIAGELQSPLDPPSGCSFPTRCALGEARCLSQVPALSRVSGGRVVACHVVTVPARTHGDANAKAA